MNIRCWWFGCERHPQDWTPPDYATCMHCGEIVSYGDMVGDTRHNRFKRCVQVLWHYLWPVKCSECGKRWRACDPAVEHDDIPF